MHTLQPSLAMLSSDDEHERLLSLVRLASKISEALMTPITCGERELDGEAGSR
jgi:hypothetical protein